MGKELAVQVLQALGADVYQALATRCEELTGRPFGELTADKFRCSLEVVHQELQEARRGLELSDPTWATPAVHLCAL